MNYFYAILWFAIGLILIFAMSKENKIFIFAGGVFLVLGCWWLFDALLPDINLFEGWWGIGLRVFVGAALVLLIAKFILENRKAKKAEQDKEKGSEGQ